MHDHYPRALVLLLLFLVLLAIEHPQESLQVSLFEPQLRRDDPVRLLFVGDMMFDREIRRKGEREGYDYILGDARDTLLSFDAVIGNLEGPITSNRSVSLNSVVGSPENTRFTFDPTVALTLREHNISILNLGNNHIFDFGTEGVRETVKHLTHNGILFFGIEHAPLTHIMGSRTITFINYNDSFSDIAEVLETIRKAEQNSDVSIVYTHWGEEYVQRPSERVRDKARAFVDAGADLVVGSHPHVVQISEVYKDTYIYYSLGNFVFDQYWDKSVQCGLALSVTIANSNTLTIETLSVFLHEDGRTLFQACEHDSLALSFEHATLEVR